MVPPRRDGKRHAMNTIYLHLPRVHTHRVIDITPLPRWRRAARAALAVLTLAVAVPVLWLLGSFVALALLGGTAAMLAIGVVRTWRMDRAARQPSGASPPSTPDHAL